LSNDARRERTARESRASGTAKAVPYVRLPTATPVARIEPSVARRCLAERVCRIGQFAPLILVRLARELLSAATLEDVVDHVSVYGR